MNLSELRTALQERREDYSLSDAKLNRKLNQAYFAFFDSYALLPQSSSSIGPQMREMRDLVPDLKSFVDVMSRVSSYEGFVQALGQLRAE